MTDFTVRLNEGGKLTIPKSIRDDYRLRPGDMFTLLDLGGVFVLSPQQSKIDPIAEQIAAQWSEEGETLESLLQALYEERNKP